MTWGAGSSIVLWAMARGAASGRASLMLLGCRVWTGPFQRAAVPVSHPTQPLLTSTPGGLEPCLSNFTATTIRLFNLDDMLTAQSVPIALPALLDMLLRPLLHGLLRPLTRTHLPAGPFCSPGRLTVTPRHRRPRRIRPARDHASLETARVRALHRELPRRDRERALIG